MKQTDEIYKTFALEDGRVLSFTKEDWELYIRQLYDALRNEAITQLANEGKLKPGWRKLEKAMREYFDQD